MIGVERISMLTDIFPVVIVNQFPVLIAPGIILRKYRFQGTKPKPEQRPVNMLSGQVVKYLCKYNQYTIL